MKNKVTNSRLLHPHFFNHHQNSFVSCLSAIAANGAIADQQQEWNKKKHFFISELLHFQNHYYAIYHFAIEYFMKLLPTLAAVVGVGFVLLFWPHTHKQTHNLHTEKWSWIVCIHSNQVIWMSEHGAHYHRDTWYKAMLFMLFMISGVEDSVEKFRKKTTKTSIQTTNLVDFLASQCTELRAVWMETFNCHREKALYFGNSESYQLESLIQFTQRRIDTIYQLVFAILDELSF